MTKKQRELKRKAAKRSYKKDLKSSLKDRAKKKTVNNRFFSNEKLIEECQKNNIPTEGYEYLLNH